MINKYMKKDHIHFGQQQVMIANTIEESTDLPMYPEIKLEDLENCELDQINDYLP